MALSANIAPSQNPLFMPEFQAVCRPIFVQLQSGMSLGTALALGVTSSARGDGRSTLALGLAVAAASQIGTQGRVLLVDADIENPTLHTRCGLPLTPGLSEVMTQQVALTQAIVEIAPGIWALPGGSKPTNATHHLKKLEELGLFEQLGKHFDAVIVDLPPVQTPELGMLPPRLVPKLVVVARAGVTKRDQLQSTLAAFPASSVTAILLNEYRERTPGWLKRFLH
jgi:tyrosine-protein kinase Etk/Wzc